MQNWFDIAIPHEDIRRGDFDEAVFAADLGDVAAGRAAEDYNDPCVFFNKTYLTQGLGDLLRKVHAKLTSGRGSSVVELQTPFGGGKTHALVAVYHYLKNGERIREQLPDDLKLVAPAVSAIVGTQLNPSEGSRSNGMTMRTLWGEVAYQIGGAEAYAVVQENDRDRVAPGKSDLRKLLEPRQPFVLLFDEVLEYVVRARGVPVGDSTLGAQTLAFFQELTEAVASLHRGLVIVTLPSSDLEDFGETEQGNLAQLEKIFGRLESIETPVQGEEVYSIIRRRLFEPIADAAAVRSVVNDYVGRYQEQRDELPPKVREADYRRKLELAYPFHPDVIDILYEKWGTFSSFQRTRGVLRLLATAVEELYQSERNLDVILPGDLNLGHYPIRQQFIQHIGPAYESILGSDVAGVEAKSQILDRQNKGWKHLAQRIATAIFVHSFAADEADKGASLPYVKLAVLRPETIPSLVTEILQKQARELWYLNTRGERYYFSSVPNLNRMVIDKKDSVSGSVRAELERRMRRELGTKLSCYLWPKTSETLADNRDLKLAILDPDSSADLDSLTQWVERRGDSFRVNKNTMFFALPDSGRYARLADAIKEYLALREIKEEIGSDDRPGMGEKRAEIERRLRDLDDALPQRIRELYRTLAVPAAHGLERIDLGSPTIGRENLDSWYWRELTDETRQKILTRPPSARMLVAKFLSKGDTLALSDVLEQFYKDTTLSVLAEPSILADAIVQGVRNGALGIASETQDGVAPSSVQFKEDLWSGDVTFDQDTVLLSADHAQALKEEAAVDEPRPSITGPEPKPPGPLPIGPNGDGPTPVDNRVKQVAFRASGIPASKIADLNRGVFVPLSREVGEFTFTVEVNVESAEGIPEKVIEQQVKETLRQLGAEIAEGDANL